MLPQPYYADDSAILYHGDALEIVPLLATEHVAHWLPTHVITDPPYSGRTHKGHDAKAGRAKDGVSRRELGYSAIGEDDTREIARTLDKCCAGWVVALSDSDQHNWYRSEWGRCGRTTFQPLPCLIKGMTVRLMGDGPSSWAVYANVARTKKLRDWGTLPGGYSGPREKQYRVGGKPMWLMSAIVRDYSKRGDVILDPFAGGGTTLRAAVDLGRRAIGVEIDEECCESIVERMKQRTLFGA